MADDDGTMSSKDMVPPADAYQSGRNAARSETRYPGTFLSGVVVGAGLPFVFAGSAAGVYKAADRSQIYGIASGIAVSALWVKGGEMLLKSRDIDVPERYRSMIDNDEWDDFTRGYRDLAREKRNSRYNFGVVLGCIVPVWVVFYALAKIDPVYD